MENRYYAGIGSRKTPEKILSQMEFLASILSKRGYILRSGGANGADSAFERGAGENLELWLPFLGFNGRKEGNLPTEEFFKIAKEIHPVYESLSRTAKLFHARNCGQILGRNEHPHSSFVLCWTPDGAETEKQCTRDTGGTGTAIKLAHRNNIPVFNMSNSGWESRFALFLLERNSL